MEQCSVASGQANRGEREAQDQLLRERMGCVKHKLLVLSGKGGVGKSTVAANLAVALARAGKRVGLLDVDMHGPSIPRLMGLECQRALGDGRSLRPLQGPGGVAVMSVGFLLESPDDAVVWRGPRKYALIREFLQRVEWGDLDFLVVDAPPGTGDEPMAVAELARPGAAAVLVTTPQDLAVADVRRSVKFCHEVSLPVIGIIENMSGLTCPACGQRIDLFKRDGGKRLAEAVGSIFLGRIPIDPGIVACGDAGDVGVSSDLEDETVKAFADVVKPILEIDAWKDAGSCEEAAAAGRSGEAGRCPTSVR